MSGVRAVVGVGASGRADAAEIGKLIDAVLAEAGLACRDVVCVATVAEGAGEAMIRAAARKRKLGVAAHPADALAQVSVPNPSEAVRERTGTPSVAEAAALLTACLQGGCLVPSDAGDAVRLVVRKRRSAFATAAVAVCTGIDAGTRDSRNT